MRTAGVVRNQPWRKSGPRQTDPLRSQWLGKHDLGVLLQHTHIISDLKAAYEGIETGTHKR